MSASDPLGALFRAAMPEHGRGGAELEAELSKAHLLSRIAGESPPSVRLGRFEILRCIGRGGMSTVFEACDGESGARLALKVLQDAPESALSRLRQEFRSLATVSHPGLVTMYELHVERELPFFTMERIDGVSLRDVLAGGARLDIQTVASYVRQLAEVLSFIHARGTIHGDIKPSNILLRSDGSLAVVDFGVACALGDGRPRGGTLSYAAPEREGRASAAADWYSLGAVLRDLLERCNVTEARADSVALQRLCSGLMAADPEARFGALDVADALGGETHQRVALGQPDDAHFVGRTAELRGLRGAFERSQAALVVCTVEAPPGMGKTALVEHFLASPLLSDALILSGRCYDNEVVPYQGFDGVLETLARYVEALPLDEQRRLLPQHAAALGHVFPLLGRALGQEPPRPDAEEPRQIRRAAFEALATLLGRIAEQRRIVVFIDDLQWGDPDGAQVLEALLLGPARPALLVIGSHRQDEADGYVSVFRAASVATGSPEMVLGPLEAKECEELVRELATEPLGEETRRALVREASGSPLLLCALLRTGPAVRDGSGARSFGALVEHALSEIGPAAREALALTALAGRAIGIELLRAAMGARGTSWELVVTLRNRHLLRTTLRGGRPALLPHHDRVGEVVLASLGATERQALHLALARAATRVGPADPEFLADHYYQAGERGEAARHAERAGDRAREALALDRAFALYSRSIECAGSERPSGLVRKLADAAAAVGNVGQAASLYLEAAQDPTNAWQLRLRAAEMYLLQGADERGLELLRPALRQAGIRLPTTMAGTLALGTLSLARAFFAERRFVSDPRALPDARIDTGFRVGAMLTMTNPEAGVALLLWSASQALRRGSAAQQGRALGHLAQVYAALGLRTQVERDQMLARALALTRSDRLEHAYVLCCDVLRLFASADCRRALERISATRSFILDQQVDAHWVLGQLEAVQASVCVMSGSFRQLDTFAAAAEREARQFGNPALVTQIRSARAWRALAAGDTAVMQRYGAETMAEWRGQRLSALYGLGVWGECHRLLYLGETDRARALMRSEATRFARSGVERSQPWSVAVKHMWACVETASSTSAGDRHFRAAASLARRLHAQPIQWGPACAKLVRAGLARRRGDLVEASREYAEARRAFESVGMEGYAAAASYREAELRGVTDRPADALPWFAAQSVAEPENWARMFAP